MEQDSRRPGLDRRPEARAESLETLIRKAREGRIRVPPFQRPLKWEARDVLALFDSIHLGLPIGSLLFWKKPAAADRIRLGPLEIMAPEAHDAWWVVDGQQRLTAITVALSRPLPLPHPPADPYVIYFDPTDQTFRRPAAGGGVPPDWVPLPYLLDGAALARYVVATPRFHEPALGDALFEAGKRIREYQVPLYIVETERREVLQEIFYRINKSGKALKWNEVHDALYGGGSESPTTVEQLAAGLEGMGMGRPDPRQLTLCLLALRGQDVTRTLAEHRDRNPDVLQGAVAEALPVLRQVLSFLRVHARIPHLRLLPHAFVLEPLTRYFALFTEPEGRTRELLVRWVWRAVILEPSMDERTLRRRAVSVVEKDPDSSVLRLLELLPRDPAGALDPPEAFDARKSASRLALLGLTSLEPRDLRSGHLVDVPALIEEREALAFPKILNQGSFRGVSNRIIHPGGAPLRKLIQQRFHGWGPEDPVLASHAIPERAARALLEGRLEEFLQQRGEAVRLATERLADRLAGWGRQDRDRPSIDFLLRSTRPAS